MTRIVLKDAKTPSGGSIVDDVNDAIRVNLVAGTISGADGAILDGVTSSIKGTVLDLANTNPQAVAIVDGAGTQITSFGGGTQYADAAARGTATGTLCMGDDGTLIQSIKVDSSGVLAIQDNAGSITVDGTFFQATQPISAVALPLPTGAATAALQLPDSHNVTVDNAAGVAAINVQDGGNSLTVDGTFWQATQPVSAASLPLPTGASTSALQTQPGVDIGDVTINNAAGATAVNIQDGGNSITVDGTFWQATQPVSGTVAVSTLPALVAGSANIGDVDVLSYPTSGGKTITYVAVSQGAAGTTVLAAADATKKHKIVGATIVMDATGTVKFNDGVVDLTGAMAIVTNGGFVWATSMIPYQETGAINRALNLITTVGAAKGIIQILTEA